MTNPSPALSVVLIAGFQRERAEGALASLLAQDALDQTEILLFDCGAAESAPLHGSDHPTVRTVRRQPPPLFHEARAEGIRLARAPVVAFLEEHCRALEGWAAAILAAGRAKPWAGIGFEVRNGNPGVGISDASYLMNYARYSPPVQRGESELIPGHNAAYRKDVLLSYGDRLADLLRNDIVMQRRLLQDGHRLGMEPDARIAHINETSLRVMGQGHYHFNRCLAAGRRELLGVSAWQRAGFVASVPIRPFLRYADNLLAIRRDRPEQFWRFLRWAPVIIASYYYSVIGLAAGLLFGAGESPARISEHELTVDRQLT